MVMIVLVTICIITRSKTNASLHVSLLALSYFKEKALYKYLLLLLMRTVPLSPLFQG